MNAVAPDPEDVLCTLKPFQRATVEHAFHRLWLAEDSTRRFLVADEVGLGKTMVAKGVAAKAINHLWDGEKTITIVYICSNGQIARQNLQRLRSLTQGIPQDNADRLTLLPAMMGNEEIAGVQLISFTPGTSFELGNSAGRMGERALLYKMLSYSVDLSIDECKWLHYLRCQAGLASFKREVEHFKNLHLDPALLSNFNKRIRKSGVLDELFPDVDSWVIPEEKTWQDNRRRNQIIGKLRFEMAACAVDLLTPDLVIMDEFQRFKDLFPTGEEEQKLSQEQKLALKVIGSRQSRTLVLSATPYKMYTLPDEVGGDDHYRDFINTISFLAGSERAGTVLRNLSVMRQGIQGETGEGLSRAKQAKDTIEQQLRTVMSRTERLAATPDRDGMLVEKQLGDMHLEGADIRTWKAYEDLARHIGGGDTFEYWRSIPFAPNLMGPSDYKVQKKLVEALSSPSQVLTELVRRHEKAFLNRKDILNYQKINPANAKMRALMQDIREHEAGRLVWIPPSLEYLSPAGIYADEKARRFTKRLVFSAWGAVPKSVAALLSYEVERQSLDTRDIRNYDDRHAEGRISFAWDLVRDAPRNLNHLTLLTPSITLAEIGDPLRIARGLGKNLPLDRDMVLDHVTEEIQHRLDEAGVKTTAAPGAAIQAHWYGTAPYLLDRKYLGESPEFESRLSNWIRIQRDTQGKEKTSEGLKKTISYAFNLDSDDPAPSDLARVLAEMAIGGPGVCALRALTRTGASMTEHGIRQAAFTVAEKFRSVFNQPDIAAIISQEVEELPYWRKVLHYAINGNFQAVLDEYMHMLVESEGLQDLGAVEQANLVAEKISGAVALRSASSNVLNVSVDSGSQEEKAQMKIRSHFATAFGSNHSQEQGAARVSSVRDSFNSPFWPFVLVSTSVGQEGLDFHTYSHAVIHWNLPGNPVDLEQREGRVHRYKGHAVRKNIATAYGEKVNTSSGDPWKSMFEAAESFRPEGDDLINPYWVLSTPGGAKIERYVPTMPLSAESAHLERLRKTLAAYRLVMGQPRQDELISMLGEDVEWLRIDLSPPQL